MAKRKGKTCLLFREERGNYRSGQYGWIDDKQAQHYIDGGIAVEYDPYEGRPERPTMDNTKDDIIQYLEDNGYDYAKSNTKSELLDLIYKEPEPEAEPEPIPEDFPARHHFEEVHIHDFNRVKELAEDGELMSVPGIGQSTEHKIKKYLGE